MKHNWRLDEHGKPDEWAWESGFHNGVYCEDCGKGYVSIVTRIGLNWMIVPAFLRENPRPTQTESGSGTTTN